jgi:hypothetical protein
MPVTRVDVIVHGGQVVTSSEVYDTSIVIKGEKIAAEGRVQPTDFPQACPEWVEDEAINRTIKMGVVQYPPTESSP